MFCIIYKTAPVYSYTYLPCNSDSKFDLTCNLSRFGDSFCKDLHHVWIRRSWRKCAGADYKFKYPENNIAKWVVLLHPSLFMWCEDSWP